MDHINPIFTITEFCQAYKIKRATFYKAVRAGRGPKVSYILSKPVIRAEDAVAWAKALPTSAAKIGGE